MPVFADIASLKLLVKTVLALQRKGDDSRD